MWYISAHTNDFERFNRKGTNIMLRIKENEYFWLYKNDYSYIN